MTTTSTEREPQFPFYPLLTVSGCTFEVPPVFLEGYQTALIVFHEEREACIRRWGSAHEEGDFMFKCGEELALLAGRSLPAHLLSDDRSYEDRIDWSRGFLFGWCVCLLKQETTSQYS